MESFARTPEIRDRIAKGRTEVMRYFWRSIGQLLGR
jgi:hypothetical protein